MNILYIAYSCSPIAGSEDKIGWNIPWESAKTNRVYVITKEEHRRTIEGYLKLHTQRSISFTFVDIPNIYKRIFKGAFYPGLLNIWLRKVLPIVRKICKEENIHIVHQINPVEFRSIGNYMNIPNAKYVVGPLGGAEYIPKGLRCYAKGNMHIECIRAFLNLISKLRLKATRKLEKIDYLMFANEETAKYLNTIGGGVQF